MKAIFVNGSPRKNFNTSQMLESAMNGAKEAGAEVEFVHPMTTNSPAAAAVLPVK